ncbi:MAG: LysE family transporter [Fulvivirga sp.]
MVAVNGIIFGLLLSILIGPVFFTVIQTSIEKGFDKAIWVAVGIFLSDLFYIFLAYLGVSQLIQKSGYNDWIGYAGGIILILFGVFSLFKSRKNVKMVQQSTSIKGFFSHIFKGFLINGVSPFVLLFWVGAMSIATMEYGYSGYLLLVFFGIILLVVFITDIIKAYLALKLRRLMTPRLFKVLNILVGVGMIAFGVRIFLFAW